MSKVLPLNFCATSLKNTVHTMRVLKHSVEYPMPLLVLLSKTVLPTKAHSGPGLWMSGLSLLLGIPSSH